MIKEVIKKKGGDNKGGDDKIPENPIEIEDLWDNGPTVLGKTTVLDDGLEYLWYQFKHAWEPKESEKGKEKEKENKYVSNAIVKHQTIEQAHESPIKEFKFVLPTVEELTKLKNGDGLFLSNDNPDYFGRKDNAPDFTADHKQSFLAVYWIILQYTKKGNKKLKGGDNAEQIKVELEKIKKDREVCALWIESYWHTSWPVFLKQTIGYPLVDFAKAADSKFAKNDKVSPNLSIDNLSRNVFSEAAKYILSPEKKNLSWTQKLLNKN